MKIIELKTIGDMQVIYPLVKQLNPDLTKAIFTRRLKEMLKNGYRCIAAMEGKEIVGTSGFWTNTRFWCGAYIEPDNVVVDSSCRSKGVGKKLMGWIEAEARRLGCRMVWLLSYT